MSISGDFAVYATKKGALPISVETRPKGKKVTIVQNVKGEAAMLLAALQAQLGVGGTVRLAAGDPAGTRRIELQGNQAERLNKALLAMDCLKGVAKSKEDAKADKAVTSVERDCAYDSVLEGATSRRKPRHDKTREAAPQFDWSLRKAPCFAWHGPWIYCRGYCELDPRTVTFDDVWEESFCPVARSSPAPQPGAKRPAPTRDEIDQALKGTGMLSEIGDDILDYSRSKSRKVAGGVYYGEDIRDPRAEPSKAVNNSWAASAQQLEAKPKAAPHKVRAPYPSWSPAAAAWQPPPPAAPAAPDPAQWADGPDPGSASGRLAAQRFDAQVGPTKARKQATPAPTTSSAEGWLDPEPEKGAPPPATLADWLDLGPSSKGKSQNVDEGFELVDDPQVWSDVSVLQVYWGAAVEEWLDAASLRNILAGVHVVEAEIGEQQGRIVCANAAAAEEATRALGSYGICIVPGDVVDLARDGAGSPEPEDQEWEALPAEASHVQEMSPKREHVPGQVTGFYESDVTALVASLDLEPQTLSRFVTFYGELAHEPDVETRFMQALERALNAEPPAFVAGLHRDEQGLGSRALAEKEQERLQAAEAYDRSQAERERLEMEAEQQHLREQAAKQREQQLKEKQRAEAEAAEQQRLAQQRELDSLRQAQQRIDEEDERLSLQAAQEAQQAEQRKAQHEELFRQRQRERQLQEQKQQEKALRELRKQEEAQRRARDEALREERARLEREREIREQRLVDEGLQALPTKQKHWEQSVASGLQPRSRVAGSRATKTVQAARALAARATQVVPRESSLEEWVAGQVRARRLAISPDVLVSLLLVATDEHAFARDLQGVVGDQAGAGFASACWRERERVPGMPQSSPRSSGDSVEAYVARFLQDQGSEDRQLVEYVTSMLAADDQDGILSLLPGMFPALDDADVLRFLSEAP